MSAAYTVELGGVEYDVLKDNLELSLQANWQGTLACDLPSYDGTYRPTLRTEVIFKADGVAIFGGILTQAPEKGFGGPNLTQIVHHLSVVSFSTYFTYRYVTETIAAGTTLKAALEILDNYLPTGVTLDPAQVTGPNLTQEFVFVRTRLDEALKALTGDTGYLPEIDPGKLFRMVSPASNAAPFDILDTGTVYQIGDLVVERTLDDTYANRILGEISSGAPTSTEVFTAADGVTSGGFIYFTTAYPASQSQNDAWPNVLILNGTVVGPVGFVGISVTNAWDWDAANHRLRYTIASGAAFPAGADTVTVTYAIGYPFYVTGNDAADQAINPIKESFVQIDQQMTLADAQAYVDALAASRAAAIERVSYTTLDNRLRPGMSQTINVASRGINETVLITEVRGYCPEAAYGDDLFFDIVAVVGSSEAGNVRQTYKDWLRSGSSAPQMTGVAGAAPSWPLQSIQSNHQGAFYGDDKFLYDSDLSGPDYGVEVLPAKVAVGVADANALALALWNAATSNDIAGAWTWWLTDAGGAYMEHDDGVDGTFIADYAGPMQLEGVGMSLSPGNANAKHARVMGLIAPSAVAYPVTVISSTPYTIDSGLGGGGQASTVFIWSHSADGTVNLPALSALNVTPNTGIFRQIIIKNETASFTCTIDPNSTEVIFDGASSAATLALTTGQSVMLQARSDGWHVVASHGVGGLTAHATTHESGGSDPIQLDDLAAPSDNTDLNATASAHGLLPKLSNNSNEYLDGTGNWSNPGTGSGSGNVTDTTAFGSEPAGSPGPSAGDLVLYNNAPLIARYTGSVWDNWGPLHPFTPPVDGDFSWVNQGGASVVTTNGGIYLSAPANTGQSFRVRVKTAPSAPYTITVAFILNFALVTTNTQVGGLLWRQSSDGKIVMFAFGRTGSGIGFKISKNTNATTFDSYYLDGLHEVRMPGLMWMRLVDNNTNRLCQYSFDGVNFNTLHTIGRTDYLTADQVGFMLSEQSNVNAIGMMVLSWEQT